jgi:hypothetical protein
MISDQVRADAGRVPSCASVAWPEKLMVSPTAQVRLAEGVSITGVGAVLPGPTVMVIGALTEEAPRASVTWSLTI